MESLGFDTIRIDSDFHPRQGTSLFLDVLSHSIRAGFQGRKHNDQNASSVRRIREDLLQLLERGTHAGAVAMGE
jgi:hypothetical protein